MAQAIRRSHGHVISERRVVDDEPDVVAATDYPVVMADRIIWFFAGLLLTLLAFRFILALLGANPANSFAHFIYSVSHPFVAPFFSLFSYNYQYGVSRFEAYTIVAMLVYGVAAYFLSWLVNIPARRNI